MNRSFILIGTMNTLPLNVRGVGLALLILAAIGHADLTGSLAASGPHFSGLGRLGRDLIRRANGEEISGATDGDLNSWMPAQVRSGL